MATADGFALPELPYALNALEPHMSARTLELHHGKHHKAYVDRANELARGTPVHGLPLEEAVVTARKHGVGPLFNYIAQIYNHNLFWQSMTPEGGQPPRQGALLDAIRATFGNVDAFRQQFIKAGLGQFGSGWVWLVSHQGQLEIVAAGNAETPLTDGKTPLLVCDLWEHAYYLDVQNRREEFLMRWIDQLAHWAGAEKRLRATPPR